MNGKYLDVYNGGQTQWTVPQLSIIKRLSLILWIAGIIDM